MNKIEKSDNKSKILSLALVYIFMFTMIAPAIQVKAVTTGNVEIAGLSPEQWNSMTEEEIDEYFASTRSIGNSGIGINVGGWTGAGGTSTNTIKIPPITIDGKIAYCARALKEFPVNTYYGTSYADSDVKLRSLLYHGYPNNASGLQAQYGLSNDQARQYTQFAMWKLLGFVGPGLAYADRIHPYSEALLAKANSGDLDGYDKPIFNLSDSSLISIQKDGYQETEIINTSGTTGTFTFPSTEEIWSVDVNGNKKSTFNVGDSFKVRSNSSLTTVKDIVLTGSFKNPQAIRYTAPEGYQDLGSFEWGPNNTVNQSLRVTFTGTGKLSIHKVNDRGDNLEGVKFGLYSDEAAANIISESVTDSNGNITFTDLDAGTYYVKELETLEGHILSNEIKEVKVIAGQTNQFDWVNETIKSKVKFYKYDEDTKKPMPNVEFKIEALTGLDKGKNWSVITDETGYFEAELAYGKYQITEVKTLEGYIINSEPINFEVNDNGQVIELSMSNKRIKSEVKLLKLDSETGLPMPNVKFTINAINGLEQGQTWEVITDESGYISMELPYGDYEITEVETLEGYVLNTTPIKFTVNQDGQVIELSMENDRVKGNAELLKVDAETKEPLANVVFELECLEGFNQGSKVELISDENGIVKISDLQYGKYRLTEIKTIEGYVLDSTPIEFEILNHGETINLVMENRKIKGKIEIIKVDGNSNKKLQGAEFGIYDKDKNLIEVITTDENGSATSSELNYGQYYYRELKSPEGYVVDGNFYEFKVEKDNIVQIVKFKNYPVIIYRKTIEPKKWNKTYNSTIPNTGDSMNVGMSLLALLASGGAIIATRRKRK